MHRWVKVTGQNLTVTTLYFRVRVTERRLGWKNICLMTSCVFFFSFFLFSVNHRERNAFPPLYM